MIATSVGGVGRGTLMNRLVERNVNVTPLMRYRALFYRSTDEQDRWIPIFTGCRSPRRSTYQMVRWNMDVESFIRTLVIPTLPTYHYHPTVLLPSFPNNERVAFSLHYFLPAQHTTHVITCSQHRRGTPLRCCSGGLDVERTLLYASLPPLRYLPTWFHRYFYPLRTTPSHTVRLTSPLFRFSRTRFPLRVVGRRWWVMCRYG